jgi:hypothetical protein
MPGEKDPGTLTGRTETSANYGLVIAGTLTELAYKGLRLGLNIIGQKETPVTDGIVTVAGDMRKTGQEQNFRI